MPPLVGIIVQMGNTKSDLPADGWTAEDFADLAPSDFVEDDPWSDPPKDAKRAVVNGHPIGFQLPISDADANDDVGATTGDDSGQPIILTQANHVSDVSVDYAEPDSAEDDLSS